MFWCSVKYYAAMEKKNEADLYVLAWKGIWLNKENQPSKENRIRFFKLHKTWLCIYICIHSTEMSWVHTMGQACFYVLRLQWSKIQTTKKSSYPHAAYILGHVDRKFQAYVDLCVCVNIEKVLEGCLLATIVVTTYDRYHVDIQTRKYYIADKNEWTWCWCTIWMCFVCFGHLILLRLSFHIC